MKALVYSEKHALADFALTLADLPIPAFGPGDLLVDIRALSTNPVDFKIRRSRSASDGKPVVLGWDAAGVVRDVGKDVQGFSVGDEVYYSGDLNRPGTYAEVHAVDARIVAKKPKSLSFAAAAALPLTAVTAWEALFERGIQYDTETVVLILGGAGGVGSIATQLLKKHTQARVIASASRPETVAWCKRMGADWIVNHRNDLRAELDALSIKTVDVVFGTTHTDLYLPLIPQLLRAFGHLVLIDDPSSLDILPFKRKAISTHWELMFSKLLHDYQPQTQGVILSTVANMVDSGALESTINLELEGLTPENLKRAHELGESGLAVGKIVVKL